MNLSPAKKKVVDGLENEGAYIERYGHGEGERYYLYIKKPSLGWTHSTVHKNTLWALLTDSLIEESPRGSGIYLLPEKTKPAEKLKGQRA